MQKRTRNWLAWKKDAPRRLQWYPPRARRGWVIYQYQSYLIFKDFPNMTFPLTSKIIKE